MGDEKKQEQDWAPEPWRWDDNERHFLDANGHFIHAQGEETTHASGLRGEACVNACEGIPTDKLKDAVMKCSVCGSPNVVYGHIEDGRTQDEPHEGYAQKWFCRKCMPPLGDQLPVTNVSAPTTETHAEGLAWSPIKLRNAITPDGDGKPLKHPPKPVDVIEEMKCPKCEVKMIDTSMYVRCDDGKDRCIGRCPVCLNMFVSGKVTDVFSGNDSEEGDEDEDENR